MNPPGDGRPTGADLGQIPAGTGGTGSELFAGQESRSWFASASPGIRTAIRELHALRPAWNLMALAFAALWVAGAAVMARDPPWPVRAACYVAIATAIHSLAILMHEGIHGNLFRRPALDRWASVLLAAPAFLSGTAYRVNHVLHHRFNRTERDPDEFTNLTKRRRLLSAAFYAWGLIGMPVYLVHVPVNALRRGTPRERADILLEYGLLAALYGGILVLAIRRDAVPLLLHAWILPAAISGIFGNVRGWAEHAMTTKGHPLTQSRTVISNRVVSLFMCNLNYHLEHHLFPAMPWYRLPRLHVLLEDDYARAGSSVYRSYLRFLWDAVRIGVHGRAPKGGGPSRPSAW